MARNSKRSRPGGHNRVQREQYHRRRRSVRGSSGVVGFAYFDQNGQFINSSSIASVANVAGSTVSEALGANAAGYFHDAGATASLQQGNQLNVLQWGPSVGNAPQAPTNTATPGAIAMGFYDNTSLNSSSAATVISQNGYSAGTLSNITVGEDGTITGSFTNGQQKTLAQLAVATFQNEDGLERTGGNDFTQTAASGLAQVGTANSGRFGSIVAGSLEESNVNLANEFTNLIVAQRAFEANSRGINGRPKPHHHHPHPGKRKLVGPARTKLTLCRVRAPGAAGIAAPLSPPQRSV